MQDLKGNEPWPKLTGSFKKTYPDNRGFPKHAKNGDKKTPLKISCQNPVEHDAV